MRRHEGTASAGSMLASTVGPGFRLGRVREGLLPAGDEGVGEDDAAGSETAFGSLAGAVLAGGFAFVGGGEGVDMAGEGR